MSKIKNIPFFNYQRQYKKINRQVELAIQRVLNSGQLILGNEVKNFENSFSRYIKVKHSIGVNSGTDAIKIALRALQIKTGDEVITVANTAVPTASAIRETGATPVFVDVKKDYTIDEKKIAAAITKKTKAILPVHLYGQPCQMPTIMAIAKKHGLAVIEDCAQAHGAKIGDKMVGAFGDIGCFSFYPTKNLGAFGDGGMILTNNKILAQICRSLRTYGMANGYCAEIEGYNSRLDEMQAAILNIKLQYIEKWNKRRNEIAKYYLTNIKNEKIILPEICAGHQHSFHLFVIRTKQRDKLIAHLKKSGVGYGIHYPFPIHRQKAYEFLQYKKGDLPITEKYSQEILSLPIFPELTENEIKHIVKTLNNF